LKIVIHGFIYIEDFSYLICPASPSKSPSPEVRERLTILIYKPLPRRGRGWREVKKGIKRIHIKA